MKKKRTGLAWKTLGKCRNVVQEMEYMETLVPQEVEHGGGRGQLNDLQSK